MQGLAAFQGAPPSIDDTLLDAGQLICYKPSIEAKSEVG